MKKLLALVLCLMMACTLSAAVAEARAMEDLFEGAWVQFEDGFELYLPAGWYEFECTPEMNAQGIFYMAGTEDMSYSCTLGWKALDSDCTVEELHAAMVTQYPDAEIIEVNDVALIAYVDAANDLLNCIALDATEPGFYMFAFSPSTDEDFQILAGMIASSIRTL